jgi:hypothetical protein
MQTYQQKMYEQSNYWLDAKEQLIMDAETHNKVIASLVQYARDQQQAPKSKYFNVENSCKGWYKYWKKEIKS